MTSSKKVKSIHNRTDWILVCIGVIIFGLTSLLLNLEKGLAAMLSFGIFSIIIQTKSETQKESLSSWHFWIIIAFFSIIHIFAIVIIPIPKLNAGIISIPFAIIDGFLMWFLINWIERHIFR